jgi:hypothetical protein
MNNISSEDPAEKTKPMMEPIEVVDLLSAQGYRVQTVASSGGAPLLWINHHIGVPLAWAERLARKEINFSEIEQELAA